MLNYKKPLVFNIEKTIRNKQNIETDQNNNTEEGDFKKRAPWLKEVKFGLIKGRRCHYLACPRMWNEELDTTCQEAK
jgi:hypothetical protein